MSTPLTLLILITLFVVFAQATVPRSRRFKYVNQGPLGEFNVEYAADYRPLDIVTFPFTLCFYNTTPNAFILGLRMGHRRSESIMRWIWDVNRGKPVKENATLTFGSDGNLVLADADGSVVWQTNTTKKGVVGLKLLPNGNLVLYDSKGKYVWQSFDYPTDTLLVGQSLRAAGGPTRLISRLSEAEPSNGPYSFVMEKRYWAMYYSYRSRAALHSWIYYKSNEFGNGKGALSFLIFYSEPENDSNHAFELGFSYNLSNSDSSGTNIFSRPKYNTTYTMLRVDIDGNLRMYTYDEHVDWGAWEVTFVLFDRDNGRASECQLPKRCGSLGVCKDDQCVACPKPQGLLGWSTDCRPPSLPPCQSGSHILDFYKVEGVEYYTGDYNTGTAATSLSQCRDSCRQDCTCLGFFYRNESSSCLKVPDLGTLVKVSNPAHVGYLKMLKT